MDLSSVTLDPEEYLVVFASGQDVENYVDPAGYLHTDFKLKSGGEYLALTDPNETIIHEYTPAVSAADCRRLVRSDRKCRADHARRRDPFGDGARADQRRALARRGPRSDSTIPAGSPVAAVSASDSMRATTTRPMSPDGTLLPGGLARISTSPTRRRTGSSMGRSRRAAVRPGGEEPPKALDNTTGTKWLAFEPTGTFYQFQFSGGQQHAVNAYTITSANDASERDPYTWTLSGSNDGCRFHGGRFADSSGFCRSFRNATLRIQ